MEAVASRTSWVCCSMSTSLLWSPGHMDRWMCLDGQSYIWTINPSKYFICASKALVSSWKTSRQDSLEIWAPSLLLPCVLDAWVSTTISGGLVFTDRCPASCQVLWGSHWASSCVHRRICVSHMSADSRCHADATDSEWAQMETWICRRCRGDLGNHCTSRCW